MAIRVHKNITEYFEDALRERLVKDYEIVAAERKRKEQERLHKEELDQRYQQIINTDPGVDAYNKDKDRIYETTKFVAGVNEEFLSQEAAYDYDTIKSLSKDDFPGESNFGIIVRMPDLEFPTDKNKLIQHAEKIKQKHKESYQLDLMKKLPDRKYTKPTELERELRDIFSTDKELVDRLNRNNQRITSCMLLVDSGKEWQQHLRDIDEMRKQQPQQIKS